MKAFLYADDLIIYRNNRVHIQQGPSKLRSAISELDLTISLTKTKIMKFTRGSNVTARDTGYPSGRPLTYVNRLTCVSLFPITVKVSLNILQKKRKKALIALL